MTNITTELSFMFIVICIVIIRSNALIVKREARSISLSQEDGNGRCGRWGIRTNDTLTVRRIH